MSRRPRVLLTGARGKLAQFIIPELAPDFALCLTDRLPAADLLENYTPADLLDFPSVLQLMEGVDAVVHLAVAPGRREDEPPGPREIDQADAAALQVNVLGAYHIFEAARRLHVPKVVLASSLTVYFGDRHRPHYHEDLPPDPQNLYACTKVFGEQLARVHARETEASVICLRLGQPYPLGGELDSTWKESRRARSSYVAVEDVAQSVRCALETTTPFGIFNIVSASDNPRFDLTAARRIGYRPRGYFSDEGFSLRDPGDIPTHTGPMVTHDEVGTR